MILLPGNTLTERMNLLRGLRQRAAVTAPDRQNVTHETPGDALLFSDLLTEHYCGDEVDEGNTLKDAAHDA